MAQSGFYKSIAGTHPFDSKKLVILCAVFIFMAGLMIFQDYTESLRQGRSFYFSESLLFKTIWFLFIPILPVLYNMLKRKVFSGSYSTVLYIIVPVFIHFLIIPFVFLLLTNLFYGGRYDLYKIITYTLANDLYILIIVYSTFVLGYKYFYRPSSVNISAEGDRYPETFVINNGKENSIVRISEVMQVLAATPYVEVQTENRKYLHTATLRSMSEILDEKDFIRVHKSAIVNIKKVSSFKSRLNGDYDLLLKNGEVTRLSRTYAPDFKKRFENG